MTGVVRNTSQQQDLLSNRMLTTVEPCKYLYIHKGTAFLKKKKKKEKVQNMFGDKYKI